jgi:hypothetical protein
MSNLFETKDYSVAIGVSPFVATPEGRQDTPAAYLVQNKTNGIVEGEHRVLGMAIRMAKEAQELLDSETGVEDNKQDAVRAVPELSNPELPSQE